MKMGEKAHPHTPKTLKQTWQHVYARLYAHGQTFMCCFYQSLLFFTVQGE